MKKRLKAWITTILGLTILLASNVFFFAGKIDVVAYCTTTVIGFGLFFDNKLHESIMKKINK